MPKNDPHLTFPNSKPPYSWLKPDGAEEVLCGSGNISCCCAPIFLEANQSVFHDHQLQQATREITAVLKAIPKPLDGRVLAFLQTEKGTLLAWVRHNTEKQDRGIRCTDSFDKVGPALKLKKLKS